MNRPIYQLSACPRENTKGGGAVAPSSEADLVCPDVSGVAGRDRHHTAFHTYAVEWTRESRQARARYWTSSSL